MPIREVISRDGQPWWRISGDGVTVENPSGSKAIAEYERLCRSMGIAVAWHDISNSRQT